MFGETFAGKIKLDIGSGEHSPYSPSKIREELRKVMERPDCPLNVAEKKFLGKALDDPINLMFNEIKVSVIFDIIIDNFMLDIPKKWDTSGGNSGSEETDWLSLF